MMKRYLLSKWGGKTGLIVDEELRKQLEGLRKWLWPKITWTIIMLGMLGLTYIATTLILRSAGGSSPKYLYKTPPEKCYCHTPGCGYVWVNPPDHCRNLVCPKCGKKNLWRKPP